MALPKIIVALLAGAAALAAADLPALRVEAVPAGSVLYVKNTASQPLTAHLIELVDYPGSSFTLFDDDIANPVAPGAEKRIPITNMTVGAAPGMSRSPRRPMPTGPRPETRRRSR
jgi:hypothetical protein